MNYERIAWCFLRRSVKTDAVAEALRTYAPLGGAAFTPTSSGFECTGPGFGVRLVTLTKLKDVMAEIAKVGQRQDELRACAMVIAIEAALDEATYQGTVFGARAPFGPTLSALPWQAVGACEALNIQLAASKPLVFDKAAGFYPSV